jgi:predicted nucleotidyltransferase
MTTIQIRVPEAAIETSCRKWRITELPFFGSVLRDDFRADSDVDVLVGFDREAPWSLFDFSDMQDELSALLERQVDLVEKGAVERSRNWIRRRHILDARHVVYAV